MSNLEKIQKGMKVFKILSKIILVFACVGVALASIGATLAAADVLNMENQFLHFLSVTAEMSKGQLLGVLNAAAVSLLFGGIFTAFAYRYFMAELKGGDTVYIQRCRQESLIDAKDLQVSVIKRLEMKTVIYEGISAPDIPVATCRVFWNTKMSMYILGRLAVIKEYRGKNLGSVMLKEAEKYIQKNGGECIALHAQCRVTAFYKKLGFIEFGDIDDDEGCPHIWMKKIF